MGGAKNCPETPRQKMIGMMYLVLTAMLALNVSTDILNGFTVVDNSLHSSIDGNNNRNGNFYYRFWKASKREEVKVGPWYKKSQELKNKVTRHTISYRTSRSKLYAMLTATALWTNVLRKTRTLRVTTRHAS